MESLKFYPIHALKEIVICRQTTPGPRNLAIVGTFDCVSRGGIPQDRCKHLVSTVEGIMGEKRTSPQASIEKDYSDPSILEFALDDHVVFVNFSGAYVSILVVEKDHGSATTKASIVI